MDKDLRIKELEAAIANALVILAESYREEGGDVSGYIFKAEEVLESTQRPKA